MITKKEMKNIEIKKEFKEELKWQNGDVKFVEKL